jgi:hypothetical protein
MDMYNKIFTKILDSSVWLEPTTTRIVWITMIAAMDENGFCPFAAVGNVAGRARVTEEEARVAIAALEGPDAESSDQDNEGRRIERVPGGWLVLNAPKYRALVTRVNIQEKTKERVRRFRDKKRTGNAPVTERNETETLSEAVAEAEVPSPAPPPDSVDTRILSESVGIFGMREQADMNRLLAVYVKESGKTVNAAIKGMIARWKDYQAAIPALEWSYGSSYKFFSSGNWDKPETWPRGKDNRAGASVGASTTPIERVLEMQHTDDEQDKESTRQWAIAHGYDPDTGKKVDK